jgi:uncharacterized membrane protein YkvA (DUF1232 family)
MSMVEKLRAWSQKAKREVQVYRRVSRDPRTPRAAKLLLGLAVLYLLSPVDLVPDFIPVLGQLDDIVVVPLLVMLALSLVPADIVEECRKTEDAQRR